MSDISTAQQLHKLAELRNKIKEERKHINIKPYSHNIVSLILAQIDKEFGRDEANVAIGDFQLEKLGWTKVRLEEK